MANRRSTFRSASPDGCLADYQYTIKAEEAGQHALSLFGFLCISHCDGHLPLSYISCDIELLKLFAFIRSSMFRCIL